MKVVIQRVKNASVKVDGKVVGEIEKGFLVLVGIKVGDTKEVDLGSFGTHTVRISNMSKCTNGETSETACGFVVEFADIIKAES